MKKTDKTLPKIALLFCGGTIGMMPDPETGALTPAQSGEDLLKQIPGLAEHCEIDVIQLFNIDSSNMNPSHWSQIADTIAKKYKEYDGFVVAQGTDTMAYSASAVSFALQGLNKPVVFTGSIVPMSELGADGRNNLIYSCFVATMDIAEVCIVFGNKIVRGNRAVKNHESFVDVFDSPNYPLLGEVERPIRLHQWHNAPGRSKLKHHSSFEPRIEVFRLFPGMPVATVQSAIERGVRGIVIQGFGPGNMPSNNELLPVLRGAMSHGISVVVSSQMQKSVTNLDSYEVGYQAKKAGAISAGDMSNEATITKLMWALGQTTDPAEVKRLMETNIAGERSE